MGNAYTAIRAKLPIPVTKRKPQEAMISWRSFIQMLERQLGKLIKVVRSDHGREFCGKYTESGQHMGLFALYLQQNGIVAQYTTPGTPSQNGVLERRNRTLKDMRSQKVTNFTVLIHTPELQKVTMLSSLEVLVKPVFQVLTPMFLKRAMKKLQNHYGFVMNQSLLLPLATVGTIATSFSSNNSTAPLDNGNMASYNTLHETPTSTQPLLTTLPNAALTSQVPIVVQPQVDLDHPSQVMENSNSAMREAVMEDELASMSRNNVWTLVENAKNMKSIGCKWIFKTKRDSQDNVERFKARLVAKGCTQRE
ncbi:uncharacterized protein LOC126602747 [Malus sylvestris]|uniref:uncharacterized protein LOC126602747 n=1 Tax=Malus sylvestris TaxID=3752 RepID=UPI0021ABFCED|nr:uncharacterized protein LOC126602747 [Malus sylvestris]